MKKKSHQYRDPMTLARNKGEVGIIRSILHAEKDSPHWADAAFSQLAVFAGRRRRPFTIENFRQYAEGHGLPVPPDRRAYGGPTQRAIRRGVIRKVGTAPTIASNGSHMALYEAVGGPLE